MKIQLSDHFGYKRLLRFTMPSILMMIFTSIYGVVDGLFISNFVDKTAFAAVNFIMPVLMILGTVGFMFGAGGSALIAKTLGEGDRDRAQRLFSLFVYTTIIVGVVISVATAFLIRPIAELMGAEGQMLEYCVLYAEINLIALPFLMLQFEFQSFFITAEKPSLNLAVTLVAGILNIVLDAIFIGLFAWGVTGAAVATAISQSIGGIIPLLYFGRKNTSLLRLTKTRFDGRALMRACTNGSSELMSNISMSVVGMLYNVQLMYYAGENGVAAYGVLMYVNLLFLSIFIGYSVGTAPVVGFHFGAKNSDELKSLLRKSAVIIGIASVSMFALAEILGPLFSAIFVGYDDTLNDMTVRAFVVSSFSYLFSGLAIYGSCFFTALNNGIVSAIISFLRTLVFQVAAVLTFPLIWGLDGIWSAVVVAELMAIILTLAFLVALRKRYKY